MRFLRRHAAPLSIVTVPMALAIVITACAGLRHPVTQTLSPEGQTAVYGRQVVAAASQAANGIDQLITSGQITNEQGVAVLTVIRHIGTEADRLGSVLLLVDAAKTEAERTAGLTQAAAIVKTIQKAVTQAVIPLGTEEGRRKVSVVMEVVANALVDLALKLPAPVTPTVWMPAWRPAWA